MNRTAVLAIALTLLFLGNPVANRNDATENTEPELAKIVADYTGLYTRKTLTEWRKLFNDASTVASLKSDGSINVRTLDAFYSAQENYFGTGREISERLENVSIATGNRMARVNADFVLRDEAQEKRGKLGIHLLREGRAWKIVGIVFSYD